MKEVAKIEKLNGIFLKMQRIYIISNSPEVLPFEKASQASRNFFENILSRREFMRGQTREKDGG